MSDYREKAMGNTYKTLLGQRLQRWEHSARATLIAVARPQDTEIWRAATEVVFAVPGSARFREFVRPGTPLVIDEACTNSGPWAGMAGPTGERHLLELAQLVEEVRATGGVVLGIRRQELVPDVNQQRIRDLYDIEINTDEVHRSDQVPRLVRNVEEIAKSLKGGSIQ